MYVCVCVCVWGGTGGAYVGGCVCVWVHASAIYRIRFNLLIIIIMCVRAHDGVHVI